MLQDKISYMNSLNFWPVLIASVIGFGISSLWYSPILFGKEWLALLEITDADMREMRERGVWRSYLSQLVAMLVTFSVLAFAVLSLNITNGSDGAFLGFLAWLGFMVPVSLSGWLWKKESFKLILIESIGYLLILVVGGAIIGAWR